MRQHLIVANWKMNHSVQEGLSFLAGLQHEIKSKPHGDIVVCPPFTSLYALSEAFEETHYQLGAQNMHWEETGAFTGEISPNFLVEIGIRFVLIGHSERRQHFGETDETVNKKLIAATLKRMFPIVCIGESEKERHQGKTFEVLQRQISQALTEVPRETFKSISWAYEPIWAIGTGNRATMEQAQEVAEWIRNFISKNCDASIANIQRILYGGSVSEETAAGFLSQADIDGLLVGGASLDPKRFAEIIIASDQRISTK